MKDVDIIPLIVDLAGSFFRSSIEAFERARRANAVHPVEEPSGLNVFLEHHVESQAAIESIVFSFLTIEAAINFMFFEQIRSHPPSGLERWLKQKWKGHFSIYDRFVLLVTEYASASLDDFQYLFSLFLEFITFRNRIVHAHPEQYQVLVEPALEPGRVFVHDVERVSQTHPFPASGFSQELAKIGVNDARRGFEIMLLVLAFLDEQLVAHFELPWNDENMAERRKDQLSPRQILELLNSRYYTKIDPESFVPEIVRNLQKAQQPTGPDS